MRSAPPDDSSRRAYLLIGPDYGRLDCAVFFADEETALAAGYRPCARCLPDRYATWKAERGASSTQGSALPSNSEAAAVAPRRPTAAS